MCKPTILVATFSGIVCSILAGCGPSPVSFGDSFYADRSPKRVAVLPFGRTIAKPADTADTAEGEALAALLTDALVAVRSYRVTERSKLKKVLAENGSTASKFVQERGLEEAGELLGADLLVLGEVNRIHEAGGFLRSAELSLSVQCVDVKSGEIVWSVSPDVKGFGNVRSLTKSLCRKIAARIQSECENVGRFPDRPTADERPRPRPRPTSRPESSKTEPAKDSTAAAQPWPRSHRIRKGDTLSDLSMTYYRSSRFVKHIVKANRHIEDPRRLKIGQIILIPAPPEPTTLRSAKALDQP